MKSMIFATALFIAFMVLTACDTEDLDCPVEQRYIDGYQEITYPSGDIYYQPLWKCAQ